MTPGLRYGAGAALTVIGLVMASAGLTAIVQPVIAPTSPTAGATEGTLDDEPRGPSTAAPPRENASPVPSVDPRRLRVGPPGPGPGRDPGGADAPRDEIDVLAEGAGRGDEPGDREPAGGVAAPPEPARPEPARPEPAGPATGGPTPVGPVTPRPSVPSPGPTTPTVPSPRPVTPSPTPVPRPTPLPPAPTPPPPTPTPAPPADPCPRPSDWPWHEREGNRGRGQGHGPPLDPCGPDWSPLVTDPPAETRRRQRRSAP